MSSSASEPQTEVIIDIDEIINKLLELRSAKPGTLALLP
jgi:hypothetical protein